GRAIRIGKRYHLRDRGLRIFLALRFDTVARHVLLERGEVGVGRNLEAKTYALGVRSAPQHHRVMIHGGCEVHRVLFLGNERQAQDLRVILGLLVEIGRFVRGVGDLVDAGHEDSPLLSAHVPLWGMGFSSFSRGSEPMTSIMAAPSQSASPIATKRSNSSAVRSRSGVATPTLSANSPTISI